MDRYFPMIELNLLADHSGTNPVRMASDSNRITLEDRLKDSLPSKQEANLLSSYFPFGRGGEQDTGRSWKQAYRCSCRGVDMDDAFDIRPSCIDC